jgi:hypothetical protein
MISDEELSVSAKYRESEVLATKPTGSASETKFATGVRGATILKEDTESPVGSRVCESAAKSDSVRVTNALDEYAARPTKT